MPGRYARHATLIPLLVLLTLVLSGCGGGNQSAGTSGQAQPTQEPQRTGTEPTQAAAQVPTSLPVPTLFPTTVPTVAPTQVPTQMPTQVATVGAAGTSARGGGEESTIQLSAKDVQFDKNSIAVQKGSRVVIEFTNNDPAPHNFAAYISEAATENIFVGEIITGPKTVRYKFKAPSESGTYFFRCDVHPDMNGQLVVE